MVAALAGCTTVSSVRIHQLDNYQVVSGTVNPFASWGGIMDAATSRAGAYCDQKGKQSHQVTMDVGGIRGFSRRQAFLVFECDPKWRYP
jgi:hypothetical protein